MTPEDLLRVRQQSIMSGMGMPPPDPMDGMIPPPEIPHGMGAPPGYPAGPTNTSPAPPAPTVDPNSAIEQLRAFQAEHAANDRLNQLLEQTPVRENPSIARKILASAMGLKGGPKAAEEIMYQPHNRAMADWTAKVGPYNQAASQERYSNANERQVLTGLATAEGNQRRYDETERNNREKIRIAEEKQELAQLKYDHPHLKFDFSGEYVTVWNPKTGEHQVTTVKTLNISKAEQMRLNMQMEEARQQNRIELKAAPGDESPNSPKEAIDQEKITRKAMWESTPEGRKFLVPNSDKSFDLIDPEELDEEDLPAFYKFRQKLYPNLPPPAAPKSAPAPAATNAPSGALPPQSGGPIPSRNPMGPPTPDKFKTGAKGSPKGAPSQVADDEVTLVEIKTGKRFATKRIYVDEFLSKKPPQYRLVP